MNPEFTTGRIRPIECVKEAYELIKDEYWLLFAVSLVGAIIGGVSMYMVLGPMICGIYLCYLKKIDTSAVDLYDRCRGADRGLHRGDIRHYLWSADHESRGWQPGF